MLTLCGIGAHRGGRLADKQATKYRLTLPMCVAGIRYAGPLRAKGLQVGNIIQEQICDCC